MLKREMVFLNAILISKINDELSAKGKFAKKLKQKK